MGLGQSGIEGHSPLARLLSYATSFGGREESVDPENRMDVGDAGIGRSVVGILLDGFLEILQGCLKAHLVATDPTMAAFQVEVIGFRTLRLHLHQRLLRPSQQRHPQGVRDSAGDLVLDGEDVLQLPFVRLGPEVEAVRDLGELGGDAHPVPGLAHASFQDRRHTKLAADLTDTDPLVFVGEGRGTGGNPQVRDACKNIEHLFRHSVTEILLIVIGAHVGEGEDGDGPLFGKVVCRGCATHSFGGDVERPGEAHGDGKTEDGEAHDQGDGPVGKIQCWKQVVRRLDDYQAHNHVDDGNPDNLTPFQIGQKPLHRSNPRSI